MPAPPTGRSLLPDEIAGPRVVAIGRGLPAERIERIAEGLVAGGASRLIGEAGTDTIR